MIISLTVFWLNRNKWAKVTTNSSKSRKDYPFTARKELSFLGHVRYWCIVSEDHCVHWSVLSRIFNTPISLAYSCVYTHLDTIKEQMCFLF